jgi:hypothetical protein
MKTKKQIKLITDAIKNTTTFEVGNIEFEVQEWRVSVWSTNNYNGSFHSIEIGAMAQSMGFSAYVTYNEDEKRCELSIV